MNEVLIKAGQLLLSLSILVLLHEFGHFIAARMFKVRVEKFYLFFNPWFSIFKFRKGDTEYGLGWLPLGGYVKISGMIDESMDKEQMKLPPQPWEFRTKPAWQRLIIMLGGIIMNVLLGIVIYWMLLFARGEEYIPNANVKYGIAVDSIGASMGFKEGDRIVAVDGKPVDNFNRIPATIIIDMISNVTVERDGQIVDVPITGESIRKVIDTKTAADFISVRFPFVVDQVSPGSPAEKLGLQKSDVVIAVNGKPMIFHDEVRKELQANRNKPVSVAIWRDHKIIAGDVDLPSDGLLGVLPVQPNKFFETKKIRYSFFGALPAGVYKAWHTLESYVKQFALIFSPTVQGYKHVGSFISFANAFGGVWDWTVFWSLTGFLSIALAFMNLLPIPALDGGHVFFTLVEMVSRRKPNEKFLEYAQLVGMIILIAIMVYAFRNDIVNYLL